MLVLKEHRLTLWWENSIIKYLQLWFGLLGNLVGIRLVAPLWEMEKAVCAAHTSTVPTEGNNAQNISTLGQNLFNLSLQQGAALIQTSVHPPSLSSVYSQQVNLGMFPLGNLPLISAGFYSFHSPDHHSLQSTVVGVCFSLTVSCGLKERVSYQLICCEFAAPWTILTGISLVPVKISADRKEK